MTEDLLRRLQNGEPDAQRELFEYCNARLRSFLLPKLPNVGDLDDCVSELVTRALSAARLSQRDELDMSMTTIDRCSGMAVLIAQMWAGRIDSPRATPRSSQVRRRGKLPIFDPQQRPRGPFGRAS